MRRRARLSLSALLLTGLAAGGALVPTVAQASEGPAPQRMLAQTDRGIELVDQDGTDPEVLVPAAGHPGLTLVDAQPSGVFLWADGAYQGSQVFHVDTLDGGHVGTFSQVSPGPGVNVGQPGISPDGRTAYYVVQGQGGVSDSTLYAQSTTAPTTGPPSPRAVLDVGWIRAEHVHVAPDGDRLLYVAIGDRVTDATRVHVVTLHDDGSASDDTTVPVPAGDRLLSFDAAWSPDSDSVLQAVGPTDGSSPGTLQVAQVVGGSAVHDVATGYDEVGGWSPDGWTGLAHRTAQDDWAYVDLATGVATPTGYAPPYTGSPLRFSGLPAIPGTDTTPPRLTLTSPSCAVDTRGCHRLARWATVGGTATDTGGGLRYVVGRAVEQRRAGWFALVGTDDPTWQQSATRRAATHAATWRVATVLDGTRWSLPLPGLRPGRLLLAVTAADHSGNETSRRVDRVLR